MEEIERLEVELKLMLENIERLKKYQAKHKVERWTPSNSRVVGEVKHRAIAMKQRLTAISYITTRDIFKIDETNR